MSFLRGVEAFCERNLSSFFRYIHAPISSDQIRLLYLKPGSENEVLEVAFRAINADDEILYEAISYCWGDPVFNNYIICKDPGAWSPRILAVTRNLYDALTAFRLPDRERVLWADAICINQSDAQEKEQQVHRMHVIYNKASKVLAWTGNGILDLDLAFKAVNTFIDDYELCIGELASLGLWRLATVVVQQIAEGEDVSSVQALTEDFAKQANVLIPCLELFARPWFSRAWVVQEAAVCDSVELHCGAESIDFDKLVLMSVLLAHFSESANWFAPSSAAIRRLSLPRTYYLLGSENCNDLFHQLFRTLDKKATVTIDKVFSLRGMASDEIKSCIPVDYDLSAEDVMLKVLHAHLEFGPRDINQEGLVSALSWLDSSVISTDGILPSWVPNLVSGFALGDLLSWNRLFRGGLYNAGLTSAYPVFHPVIENERILITKGVSVTQISELAEIDLPEMHPSIGSIPSMKDVVWSDNMFVSRGVSRELVMMLKYPPTDSLQHLARETNMSLLQGTFSAIIRWLRQLLAFVTRTAHSGDTEERTWRTIGSDMEGNLTRRPKHGSGDNYKFPVWRTLLDVKPDLGESSNWTSAHSALHNLADKDLEDMLNFPTSIGLIDSGSGWANLQLFRAQDGNLGWTPRSGRRGDSI